MGNTNDKKKGASPLVGLVRRAKACWDAPANYYTIKLTGDQIERLKSAEYGLLAECDYECAAVVRDILKQINE